MEGEGFLAVAVADPPGAVRPAAPERDPDAPSGRRLVDLAVRGLRSMYLPAGAEFVQTTRGLPGPDGPRLVTEGTSLRYTAICALGLGAADDDTARSVLAGRSAADLARAAARHAAEDDDPGAVALAAWAVAEVAGEVPAGLHAWMTSRLTSGVPVDTVAIAWMLTAATAAAAVGAGEETVGELRSRARDVLLSVQGPGATFPHAVPAGSRGRLRAHVGSFADQVYPLQALARHAAATGDGTALDAADACAARLVDLQGGHGQWWWHYDARDGSVVEPFPVYSVHQHGMAPMVLLDLAAAGGTDHVAAARLGVDWLRTHPETFDELVDDRHGVVWRKVGRREPRKAARTASAVTTALRPGLRLPGLDAVLPPGPVDRECRPYELGWLLYAWLRPDGVALRATDETRRATDETRRATDETRRATDEAAAP